MRRSQICRQLRNHLAAQLDATPYQQDDEAWHVALRPLRTGIDLEPEPLAHLALTVVIGASSSDDLYRSRPGHDMRNVSRLEVSFNYRLRPDSQLTDWDLASDAAEDVAKLVFDEDRWAFGQLEVVRVEDAVSPQLGDEELILAWTLIFTMLHRQEI